MDQENATNRNQSRLTELLARLTVDQVRFMTARLEVSTDREAAAKIKITPGTVSRWQNRAEIDEAMRLVLQDPLESATAVIRRNVLKAVMVKIAGLDSKIESVRQAAATEIIDRNLGKPNQPLTGKDGGPIEYSSLTDTELVRSIVAAITGLATLGTDAAGDGS